MTRTSTVLTKRPYGRTGADFSRPMQDWSADRATLESLFGEPPDDQEARPDPRKALDDLFGG